MSNMHQGLDLSRFKKVSSDKKTTTLRHAKGHEIKIAHSGLKPKMKERLEGLPVHMAEGGEPVEPIDDESPAEADDTPEDAPAAAEPAAAPAAPTAAAAPEDTEEPAATAEPAKPQAPAPQPINAQQLKLDDVAMQHDLDMGYIKPETYHDLFAKKDTLGKIGTLFGMMLSGAGAGLAHQPNALLGMMKDQITNDLEAQKSSASNRQNLIQINQKQQLQTSQIKKWQQEGLLNEAQAKAMIADAKIKTFTLANMQGNRLALHHVVMAVNKTAPGTPERAAAEQKLGLLTQAIQGENFDLADKAAAASALGNMAFGPTPANGNPEGTFNQQQGALIMSGNKPLAEERQGKHLPGVQGQASVPLLENP